MPVTYKTVKDYYCLGSIRQPLFKVGARATPESREKRTSKCHAHVLFPVPSSLKTLLLFQDKVTIGMEGETLYRKF